MPLRGASWTIAGQVKLRQGHRTAKLMGITKGWSAHRLARCCLASVLAAPAARPQPARRPATAGSTRTASAITATACRPNTRRPSAACSTARASKCSTSTPRRTPSSAPEQAQARPGAAAAPAARQLPADDLHLDQGHRAAARRAPRPARRPDQGGQRLHRHPATRRLKTLQARALLFKPYNKKPDARRMPDDLAEQLVRASNDLRTQHKAHGKAPPGTGRRARAVRSRHRALPRADGGSHAS